MAPLWVGLCLVACADALVPPRRQRTATALKSTPQPMSAAFLQQLMETNGMQVADAPFDVADVLVAPRTIEALQADAEDVSPLRGRALFDDSLTDLETLLEFQRRGHVCTRDLFTAEEVFSFKAPLENIALQDEARCLAHAAAMNDDEGVAPFLQTFNPHRVSQTAYQVAASERLASTAAMLLGVDSVRVYQSCVFRKRLGDVATNWHSDLRTSPLDTNSCITAWIPLHHVPASNQGGTALQYADGSHADVSLVMWYGEDAEPSEERYEVSDHGSLCVGDVSWHHGWTLHSAPENTLAERFAYTVTYFADGARLVDEFALSKVVDEDAPSYADWIDQVEPGQVLDHFLLPIVFSSFDDADDGLATFRKSVHVDIFIESTDAYGVVFYANYFKFMSVAPPLGRPVGRGREGLGGVASCAYNAVTSSDESRVPKPVLGTLVAKTRGPCHGDLVTGGPCHRDLVA